MFINGTLYTVCSIALPILVCIGLSVLFKKKFNNYYGVLIGLILSGFLFGFMQAGIPKLYVVNKDLKVKHYRIIGTLKYTLDNGEKISSGPNPMEVIVINNSPHNLVLQQLVYGDPDFYQNKPQYKEIIAKMDSSYQKKAKQSKIHLIEPFKLLSVRLPYKRIDFFFDEPIPQKIREYGSNNKVKYWLRKAE